MVCVDNDVCLRDFDVGFTISVQVLRSPEDLSVVYTFVGDTDGMYVLETRLARESIDTEYLGKHELLTYGDAIEYVMDRVKYTLTHVYSEDAIGKDTIRRVEVKLKRLLEKVRKHMW